MDERQCHDSAETEGTPADESKVVGRYSTNRADGRGTFSRGIAYICLLTAAPLSAQPGWRFWTVADGMTESYTQSVATGSDGRVYVRHGEVTSISVLDGYSVRQIPEARAAAAINWNLLAPVRTGLGGALWIVEDSQLKQFQNGRWNGFGASPRGGTMRAVVPQDSGDLWVLFQDRLEEFSPATRSWKLRKTSEETGLGTFSTMAPGRAGEVWITAQLGVARLARHNGQSVWSQQLTRAIGLSDNRRPLPMDNGMLYFAAQSIGDKKPAAARWDGSRLEVVASQPQLVHAWPGLAGSLWTLGRTSLEESFGSDRWPVQRRGPLTGSPYDLATLPAGIFWLATSEGVARYAPPLWRTPEPVRRIEDPIYGIAEGRDGRLWFAGTQDLIEYDGVAWKLHPLPPAYRLHTGSTEYVSVLPDGRVSIKAFEGVHHRLLLFDPRTNAFQPVTHPEGRDIILAWRRDDGSLWVATSAPCHLEVFNGRSFTSKIPVQPQSLCPGFRDVKDSSDGSVWAGTTAQGGVMFRKGEMRRFGPKDGFPEPAVFALYNLGPSQMLAAGRDALAEYDGTKWSVWRRGLDRTRSMLRSRDGTLWLASASGIHRLQRHAWITNVENDGLPSDICYKIFEDSRGVIWVGTARGIARYYPEADQEPPLTYIASASNAAEVSPEGNAKIAFAAVDKWKYTSDDRLLYSYQLDGGNWTPFDAAATASLTRLTAGRHSIQARAMDRNANISAPSDPFVLTVLQPWYRQSGFLAIFGASLAAIAFLLALAVRQYRALERAKLAAESASRYKSTFLANMSHEIRTPMNAILGMTDLAADSAVDADQRDCLLTARKSAESLLVLLNDILDFSKVEAGKLELSPVHFRLSDCLAGVKGTMRVPATNKGLEFVHRIHPDVPPYLYGDESRLRQILLNLSVNAVKFTPSGRVSLDVWSEGDHATTHGSHVLHFRVADTGIGIPPEKQELIFAPFEQADASVTRNFGGTGLGLAISINLVRLMNGRMWVESPWHDLATGSEVTGSAFHFTAAFETGQPQRPAEAPPSTHAAISPLRILLVEDILVNQKVASRILEKMGHSVAIAANGREAVTAFEQTAWDVIFMDVQMPEMGGIEATQIIRRLEDKRGGHTPIIGLTARALPEDREECLRAGMDGYLTKPIHRDELIQALEGCVLKTAR